MKPTRSLKFLWRHTPWPVKLWALKILPGHFLRNLNILVTSKCNLRCKFCNIGARSAGGLRSDAALTLENFERNLFGGRTYYTVTQVHFSGGEPFLRSDLVALCDLFASGCPNASFSIATNGTLTDKILDFCRRISERPYRHRIHIGISLDALGDLHDEIRGVQGTYKRVLETITTVKERYPEFFPSLDFTIIPDNLHELRAVGEWAKEKKFAFNYRMAAESEVYYGNNRGCLPPWDEPKLQNLEESIRSLWASGVIGFNPEEVQKVFFRDMVHAYRIWKRRYDCFAGLCFVFIDSDGNIRPCNMLDFTFGNIGQDDLLQALRSKPAKEARRYIAQRKCFCWIECETFNSWGTAAWLGIPIRDQLRVYEKSL